MGFFLKHGGKKLYGTSNMYPCSADFFLPLEILGTRQEQVFWIKETSLLYMVKEIFTFNIDQWEKNYFILKKISYNQRYLFTSKKFFLWLFIKETILWVWHKILLKFQYCNTKYYYLLFLKNSQEISGTR